MDARIGKLIREGKEVFYAFVNGNYTEGALENVEVALGLRAALVARTKAAMMKWNVTMVFQFPAWDEVNGIPYKDIEARSKSEAIKEARRQAEYDGHAIGGRGRYWFKAEQI